MSVENESGLAQIGSPLLFGFIITLIYGFTAYLSELLNLEHVLFADTLSAFSSIFFVFVTRFTLSGALWIFVLPIALYYMKGISSRDFVDSTRLHPNRISTRSILLGLVVSTSFFICVVLTAILLCKTQVASVKTARKPLRLPKLIFGDVPYWDEENEILIEPLPNMAVIKDLIVDMRPFWKFYQEVKPYFTREWKDLAPESLQAPKDARSIENLVYCILCGVCWTCPVNAENPHYLGPAALAKAYRFIADTRFNEDQRSLVVTRVSDVDAVPACEKHFVCNRVCPKNVKPGTAIKDIRDQYLIQ